MTIQKFVLSRAWAWSALLALCGSIAAFASPIRATLTVETSQADQDNPLVQAAYQNLPVQSAIGTTYDWAKNALGERVTISASGETNGIPRDGSIEIDFESDLNHAEVLTGLISSGAPIHLTLNQRALGAGTFTTTFFQFSEVSPDGLYVWDDTSKTSLPMEKYLDRLSGDILKECRDYYVKQADGVMAKINQWMSYTKGMVQDYGDFQSCVNRHFGADSE